MLTFALTDRNFISKPNVFQMTIEAFKATAVVVETLSILLRHRKKRSFEASTSRLDSMSASRIAFSTVEITVALLPSFVMFYEFQ